MKEGYKKTELGWIPEEWQIKKLGDIFEFNGGMSISREKLVDEGVNYLHYGDIHKRNKNYIDVTVDKTWLPKIQDDFNSIKDTVKLTDGDVVFADASEDYEGIGKSVSILNKDNEEFVSGLHTIIAKDIYKSLDRQFKRFCFSTNDIRKQFRKLAVGTSVYGISKENIKKIYMPIPTLKEQEKISDILSNTDKLIEKTKELKKGLMQRLLTKGIGHKEFKNSEVGEIPVNWEVNKLGELVKVKGGYAFKSSDNVDYGVKWLKIANVSHDKIIWENTSYLPEGYLSEYKEYQLNERDYVIALTRPITQGTLKMAKLANKDVPSLLNQRVGKLNIVDGMNINIDFIYYVMSSKYFINEIDKEIAGTDPPNISSGQLENIKIVCPSFSEQKQIANILSAIDNQIGEYDNEKVKLEELKKGLMQQLLTGKLRVI